MNASQVTKVPECMSEIERAAVCEHVEFEVKGVIANLDGLTAENVCDKIETAGRELVNLRNDLNQLLFLFNQLCSEHSLVADAAETVINAEFSHWLDPTEDVI